MKTADDSTNEDPLAVPDFLRRSAPAPEALGAALPVPAPEVVPAAPPDHNEKIAGAPRLGALAAEINERYDRVEKTIRKTADEMVETGKLLLEAKALVKHGEFKKWIDANLKVPYRTAAYWMNLARSKRGVENFFHSVQLLINDPMLQPEDLDGFEAPPPKSAIAHIAQDGADKAPPPEPAPQPAKSKPIDITMTAVKAADGRIEMKPKAVARDPAKAPPDNKKRLVRIIKRTTIEIVDHLYTRKRDGFERAADQFITGVILARIDEKDAAAALDEIGKRLQVVASRLGSANR